MPPPRMANVRMPASHVSRSGKGAKKHQRAGGRNRAIDWAARLVGDAFIRLRKQSREAAREVSSTSRSVVVFLSLRNYIEDGAGVDVLFSVVNFRPLLGLNTQVSRYGI